MREGAGARAGDVVTLEIKSAGKEREPRVPANRQCLQDARDREATCMQFRSVRNLYKGFRCSRSSGLDESRRKLLTMEWSCDAE